MIVSAGCWNSRLILSGQREELQSLPSCGRVTGVLKKGWRNIRRFRTGKKVDPLYFGETQYASAFMLVRLRLNDFRCVGLCFLWRNVLIKPKEIAWIIVRFDSDEACPPFAVGLRDSIIFISAHEVDVHPRSH